MLTRLDGHGTLANQIYRSLRGAILAGELRAGARLPATRAMAVDLGVSRNTVLLAYAHLLAEGYVAGTVGSGTFVAPSLPDAAPRVDGRVRRAEGAGPAAPRLSAFGRRLIGAGLPPGPVPAPGLRHDFRYGVPAVEEFPHETWRRLSARRARSASVRSLGYGPTEGHGPLRQAIASYLARARGVACEPEQVLVVNGSQQALDLVARVLVDPGQPVVIEEPHYLGARGVFQAAGARLIAAPVDADGLDADAFPGAARRARLAYVTPSHQFPTGAIMSLARRLALLAWADRTGAYVVEDDYDSEYRYASRPVEALQGLDRTGRVIYVGTFSKVLFPALRLGYLVLPRPLVEPFRAAKWLADRHTPVLPQEVLTDFIGEGHFERHLRRARTTHGRRRAALLEAIDEHLGERITLSGANAGMHVLAWLRGVRPRDLGALVARAARAGVGVYPVAPCYLTPPRRAGLLLGYVSMTEREIAAGILALASVWPERRNPPAAE